MESVQNLPLLDATSYRKVEPPSLFVSEPPELGRDDFLRLLVSQLENQNPLEPLQDTEFVAQLANFSSLEQLIDLNSRMDSVLTGQSQLVNSQSLNLIGREVLVVSDGRMIVDNDGADTITFEVLDAVESARVDIYASSGELADSITLENPAIGRHSVSWQEYAESLTPGEYGFRVTARYGDGTEKSLHGFLSLPVEGVHIGDGGLSLVSRNRVIPFDRILEIRQQD